MPESSLPPVMPFYLVFDLTTAASAYRPYYRSGIRRIVNVLGGQPWALDSILIAAAAIDERGAAWSSRGGPAELDLPEPQPDGHSGAVLTERVAAVVKPRITSDLSWLRSTGRRCFRPALFLVGGVGGFRSPAAHGWRDLIEYDAGTAVGNAWWPVVMPMNLSPVSDTAMQALAHPSVMATRLPARANADPATAVAEALDRIGDIICASVRTLREPPPRHVLPPLAPGEPVNRSDRSDREPVPSARLQLPQAGGLSHVPMCCSRDGRAVVAKFRQYGESWVLEASGTAEAPPPASASRLLSGTVGLGPDYRGCARCGNGSIAKCQCGQLGCWDGVTPTYRCQRCGQGGPLVGQFNSVQAID